MHPFRKLLLISLGRADSFEKTPTHRDWLLLFDMAKQQALLGVLYDGILRLPEDQRPPESILTNWQHLAGKIEEIHARHETHVKELETLLQKLGLHGCLLKGTGLSHLYPVPGTHDSILDTFDEAGYGIWGVIYQECKVDIFEDTIVEVHFHPSKTYNPFHNARLQRWLEEHSPIRDDGSLPEPGALFNAVFCMAHMFRHYLEGGLGLRQMMDYYYVLRVLDPADRQPVMDTLKSLGMDKFAAALMLSLQFNFGLEDEYLLCPPDSKLGRKLIEDAISMGNFGVMDSRNRAKKGEGPIGRFIRKNGRVFSNLRYYPGEVIWSPFARLSQFVWRFFKGYL